MNPTPRQQTWITASDKADQAGNALLAGFFALVAQPNDRERGHDCREYAVGFSRNGRRGFKCGMDNQVIRWVDA